MGLASGKFIGKLCALAFIAALGSQVGCGGKVEVETPPPVRPVKLFKVSGIDGAALRNFPSTVDASQRADVAFRVSGRIQEMLVREGDLVERDHVLARLDPTDYKIIVQDRQATFDKDARNFERAQELIADGNISKFDYDRMEAAEKSSRAALDQAIQDLAYTELRAPFSGRIARRDVENFEEVRAKQTVFHLQNVAELDVKVDLSESLIRTFSGNREAGERLDGERPGLDAFVQFEGRPGTRFPLKIKAVATKADPQTQTFRVTFTMPAPNEFTVLPGMTATVSIDFSDLVDKRTAKWVPVRAIQADSGLDPRVWVLDGETMTVSSRPVTIGRMSGDKVEVSSGLKGGEEIVAVGAAYLAEGMPVTRMKLTEQAEPRPDDPA